MGSRYSRQTTSLANHSQAHNLIPASTRTSSRAYVPVVGPSIQPTLMLRSSFSVQASQDSHLKTMWPACWKRPNKSFAFQKYLVINGLLINL